MLSPSQKQWYKIANRVRSKVNFGWFMETLALPLVVSSIAIAATIIALRRYWLEFDLLLSLAFSIPLVLIITLICAFTSRKKYESKADAFIRLESSMGLHSSLTSAEAGTTSWPLVPENIDAGVNWNYRRLSLPLLGSIILLSAAYLIDIQAQVPPTPAAAPRAWENLNADLEELKQKNIVQEDYIKEIESKLAELKDQPEKDWYSHPSLEATENLKQSHQQALKKLSKNLDDAEKSLSTLKKYSKNLTEAQKNKLLKQFGNAMEALEKGRMKPNKELLEELKKVDPKMLNNLSPEQLQELRENMQNMSAELKKQLRDQLQPNQPNPNDLDGTNSGQTPGSREDPLYPGDQGDPNNPGGQPGQGDGEAKHAPKVLGDEAHDLDLGDAQKLDSKNLKNTLPGDLLETKDGGEHEVDKSKTKQQQGGSTENTGEGGDEVWKSNYLPKEKRALKNFFGDKPKP